MKKKRIKKKERINFFPYLYFQKFNESTMYTRVIYEFFKINFSTQKIRDHEICSRGLYDKKHLFVAKN